MAVEGERVERMEDYPLLDKGPFPRFDAIQAKHVLPGIRAVLEQLVIPISICVQIHRRVSMQYMKFQSKIIK